MNLFNDLPEFSLFGTAEPMEIYSGQVIEPEIQKPPVVTNRKIKINLNKLDNSDRIRHIEKIRAAIQKKQKKI